MFTFFRREKEYDVRSEIYFSEFELCSVFVKSCNLNISRKIRKIFEYRVIDFFPLVETSENINETRLSCSYYFPLILFYLILFFRLLMLLKSLLKRKSCPLASKWLSVGLCIFIIFFKGIVY